MIYFTDYMLNIVEENVKRVIKAALGRPLLSALQTKTWIEYSCI